jgi:hypothetical protein
MNSDSLNFKMVWQILFYYIQAPALMIYCRFSILFWVLCIFLIFHQQLMLSLLQAPTILYSFILEIL